MSTNDPYATPESPPSPTYETVTRYPKPERPWLVPVLVTMVAFLTVGFLAVAGYFLLTESNPIIDSVDPQPELSEQSGYEQAQILMETVWADMSVTEQADICGGWNTGLEGIFLDSFMEGAGSSANDLGITDAELRAVVTDFMNEEC